MENPGKSGPPTSDASWQRHRNLMNQYPGGQIMHNIHVLLDLIAENPGTAGGLILVLDSLLDDASLARRSWKLGAETHEIS